MKNYPYFLKEAGSALMDVARSALDVILPRECIVCGRRLNADEKYLCIYCEADLPLTHYWERRRNPMADKLNEMIQKKITAEIIETEGAVEKESAAVMRTGGTVAETEADASRKQTKTGISCAKGTGGQNARPLLPVKYSYATALFFYRGEAGYRKIPQQLKYHAHISEGKFYARTLGKMIAGSPHFQDIDMIIPVPLHWLRRWSRGYNQAEVIAKAIAGETGTPVRTDILRRIRHTKTQTKLGIADKWRNVSGAFTLTAKAASGKAGYRENHGAAGQKASDAERIRHILVVDDVFTTGATVCACINVLQDCFGNGARISAATLGYVSQD